MELLGVYRRLRQLTGHSGRRCLSHLMFLTSMVAIAPEVDLGKMPVSGGRTDPSFVHPGPGWIRPPVHRPGRG